MLLPVTWSLQRYTLGTKNLGPEVLEWQGSKPVAFEKISEDAA